MALNKNKSRLFTKRPDDVISFPVRTNTKIYDGSFLTIDSNGYARPANTSDSLFLGVSLEEADNTVGANGAVNVKVSLSGIVRKVSITGISGQAGTGTACGASDDDTFVNDPSGIVDINGVVVKWNPGSGNADLSFKSDLI